MTVTDRRRTDRLVVGGLAVSIGLVAAAMAVPAALDWNVHVFSFPPLHAQCNPRIGVGTLPAVVLGALTVRWADPLARRCSWRSLLLLAYGAGLVWLASLALVDGTDGIGVILDTDYEYLDTARTIDDLGAVSSMLHEYVDRIPYSHPDNWPVHLAGHPPGAVLFFVALGWLGLGSGLAAGWAVVVVAATTPLAVLVTLRRLDAEAAARTAAPFLVVGPAAIWAAVSADAVFAAAGAWGLCCLAIAATSTGRGAWAPWMAWSVLAGVLLGYCVMLSYGLPLLAILAVAVLWLAGSWRPLVPAAVAALAVVLGFALAGFSWWEAFPVLRERYWDGVASRRPASYWMWGNVAALVVSAGPAIGAGLALTGQRLAAWRRGGRPGRAQRAPVVLAAAAALTVAVADASQMSKAEVERIWLPFVPWLLVATALLPPRWRRPVLALQVVTALVVQHLLFTGW